MQENKVEQCKHSPNVIQMEKAFQEGCKFEGFMKVNRVSYFTGRGAVMPLFKSVKLKKSSRGF